MIVVNGFLDLVREHAADCEAQAGGRCLQSLNRNVVRYFGNVDVVDDEKLVVSG